MKLLMESWRQYLKEDEGPLRKAIFMAGAPGSGKSTVIDKLGLDTLEIINPDEFYEPALEKSGLGKDIARIKENFLQSRQDLKDLLGEILQLVEPEDGWSHDILAEMFESAMDEANGDRTFIHNLETTREKYETQRAKIVQQAKLFNQARNSAKEKQSTAAAEGQSFVVDGTGGRFGVIRNQKEALEDQGYDVGMIFVDIPLDDALARQQSRLEAGGRALDPKAVEKSWNAVNKNLELYSELFGDNLFRIVATDDEMDASIAEEGERLSAFLGGLEEDFQSELKPRLQKQMTRLLRHGGNKDSGPFDKEAPIDYRGSAPPGAPGG
jgi:predicted ABC-type ATPase